MTLGWEGRTQQALLAAGSGVEGCVCQLSLALFYQVLRQLQQGLAKCYSVAFEKSGAVSDAKITPHTLNFVKKLVSTFGVGLENVSNVSTMFSSAASESLARRAQATAQDPVFQKLKGQFTTGKSRFSFPSVGRIVHADFLRL